MPCLYSLSPNHINNLSHWPLTGIINIIQYSIDMAMYGRIWTYMDAYMYMGVYMYRYVCVCMYMCCTSTNPASTQVLCYLLSTPSRCCHNTSSVLTQHKFGVGCCTWSRCSVLGAAPDLGARCWVLHRISVFGARCSVLGVRCCTESRCSVLHLISVLV